MQQEFSYEEAFSRNMGVLTPEAQQLLRNSCIAVAGVGGVGGTASEQLARMGIGYLKIADHDAFELSNVNRQVGASISTLGRKKTEVICEQLKGINPEMRIDSFSEGVTIDNVAEFVKGADAIIDAVDYFSPGIRFAIHRAARAEGKYVLTTPVTGFGAVFFCFGPDTPPIEEVLEFPEMQKLAGSRQNLAKKLMGGDLAYLPKLYFEKVSQEKPYPSTVGPAVTLAGCVTATQTLKLLMQIEQAKNPAMFAEYGSIKVTKVPEVMRIDTWDEKHCRVVNLEQMCEG
ncbi:MAG: ThiF family adenylyltransferase [Candidatus Woesearchaeota archaeon]